MGLLLGTSLIEYLGSLLRLMIFVVVPPVVALPMVVPPSSFFVNLGTLFGPSTPLIVVFLQKISGQHIPKGIYVQIIQSKDSVVIELKVIFYATEKVCF